MKRTQQNPIIESPSKTYTVLAIAIASFALVVFAEDMVLFG
jgi:hypothetical protein